MGNLLNEEIIINQASEIEDKMHFDQITSTDDNLEELEEYRRKTKVLGQNNSNIIFSNRGAGHAAILLGSIFDISKVVRIYANDMNGDIGQRNDYYDSLVKFLDRDDTVLKIILNDPNKIYRGECESRSVKLIMKKRNEGKDIVLVQATDEFKKEVKQNIHGLFYTVGDQDKYRIEYDNISHKASASFNDPILASKLIEIFDAHFA